MSFVNISQLPSSLVEICQTNLNSHTLFITKVLDISEKDKAFKHIVEKSFSISFSDKLEESFKNINFKDFRNQVSLCYLSYLKCGDYFFLSEVKNELDMLLDLEKKFFKFSEGENSRFFLLLLYIKITNMGGSGRELYSFGDIYRVLDQGQATPNEKLDWLIVLIQSLIDILKEESLPVITKVRGDFSQILENLDLASKKSLIDKHLSYAYAINDYDYFLYNKV